MASTPKSASTYEDFAHRFPRLAEAWALAAEAGAVGPLDERTARLVKLALAVGAQREMAVRASAAKARAMGIEPEAIEQVVAIAASALCLPAVVETWEWIADGLERGR